MRQLETDRLTNCDDEREIGSKSATMREKLAHKLQQFEGHGSQSVNERKIGSQTRERVFEFVFHPKSDHKSL